MCIKRYFPQYAKCLSICSSEQLVGSTYMSIHIGTFLQTRTYTICVPGICVYAGNLCCGRNACFAPLCKGKI